MRAVNALLSVTHLLLSGLGVSSKFLLHVLLFQLYSSWVPGRLPISLFQNLNP